SAVSVIGVSLTLMAAVLTRRILLGLHRTRSRGEGIARIERNRASLQSVFLRTRLAHHHRPEDATGCLWRTRGTQSLPILELNESGRLLSPREENFRRRAGSSLCLLSCYRGIDQSCGSSKNGRIAMTRISSERRRNVTLIAIAVGLVSLWPAPGVRGD